MRSRRPLAKQLAQIAERNAQARPEWLQHSLRPQLTSNLALMRELYRVAGAGQLPAPIVAQRVQALLNACAGSIQNVVQQLQLLQQVRSQQQHQPSALLHPSHPSIINNINHPLNPSNPLNLQLNPAMNLLFQRDEAVQASILEIEEEEKVENDLKSTELATELLADTTFQHALETHPEITNEHMSHQTLGLSPKISHSREAIEAACLDKLAEHAPREGAEPSHEFHKIAAAAAVLGFGHHELAQVLGQEEGHRHVRTLAPAAAA